MHALLALLSVASGANAYWLMGANFLTQQRIDPIVTPGKVSSHVHSVLGGSNFGFNVTTAKLRESECTSTPIAEDKSSYWFPSLYFEWSNGSFSSLSGGSVVYYLFDDQPGKTTPFPDNFRMISGDPTLRTYDASSKAQQAVTFLCLDFNGQSTRHNELPTQACPSGVRAQINFPSCWDNQNMDSEDHKSHVAFPSGGPDSGTCNDPKFPKTLPRIFIEVYWDTASWDSHRSQAKDQNQPFVFSYGDPTGDGYHADFVNGWMPGVLQKAVDGCNCNPYGDPSCCADKGIFTYKKEGSQCKITNSVDEQVLGTLPKLPGNNPVQPAGKTAKMLTADKIPGILSPVYVYYGDKPDKVGTLVQGPQDVQTQGTGGATSSGSSSSNAQGSSSSGSSGSNNQQLSVNNNSGSSSGSKGAASGNKNNTSTCAKSSKQNKRSFQAHRARTARLESSEIYRRFSKVSYNA